MHLMRTEFESLGGRGEESAAFKEHLAPVATIKEI
jgi:hypothetical protein